MPKYVDGFVFPIAKKNLAAYKKMAAYGGKIWKKYGALEYMECIGEDLSPKAAASMPPAFTFLKLVKPKKGETLGFSFIVFKSRKHRDQVNAKVMKHMMEAYDPSKDTMPFDPARMAYGGFSVIVDA